MFFAAVFIKYFLWNPEWRRRAWTVDLAVATRQIANVTKAFGDTRRGGGGGGAASSRQRDI
jgi:hypothetical protein